jgi:hypothetical protein
VSEISAVHTPCKNCVFAVYENNTQTDCFLKYLDKYRQVTSVLEAYDDNKEFFIINEKKCLGYREQKWFDRLDMQNSNITQKAEKVLSNNYIKFSLVVNLKEFDLEHLDNLTNQIKNLHIQPEKIIFIRYQKDIKRKECSYESIKSLIDKAHIDKQWRIQTMLEDLHYYEVLHNVVATDRRCRFFCGIEKPCDSLNNIVVKANSVVYNELKTFRVISNKDKSVLFFDGGVYRYCAVVNKTNLLSESNSYTIV